MLLPGPWPWLNPDPSHAAVDAAQSRLAAVHSDLVRRRELDDVMTQVSRQLDVLLQAASSPPALAPVDVEVINRRQRIAVMDAFDARLAGKPVDAPVLVPAEALAYWPERRGLTVLLEQRRRGDAGLRAPIRQMAASVASRLTAYAAHVDALGTTYVTHLQTLGGALPTVDEPRGPTAALR